MTSSAQDGNNRPEEPTYLKISDRLSLRYQKSGDGPPLILLHTIRTQLEYFRQLAPLLAEKFTVFAVDLPGHGHSSVDTSAPYDEPYIRNGIVAFLKAMNLRDVTLVGESIGAVIALTSAADAPERIRAVYALNTYDYETRYGDGIRRGNWFANLIIGSLQVPVFGAIGAAIATPWMIGKIMKGGYADPRKLPADLVALFHKTGGAAQFPLRRAKGAGGMALLEQCARVLFRRASACHAHLRRQGLVTYFGAKPHERRAAERPHVYASEYRSFLVGRESGGSRAHRFVVKLAWCAGGGTPRSRCSWLRAERPGEFAPEGVMTVIKSDWVIANPRRGNRSAIARSTF